ncbi:MAG: MBL fold metallo-hydrolase [Thermodesulfobacteriota bacterium]|nr:MBL fold metallo-hydrolase [Thermodesulfobacteriota bacterium]
MHPILIEIKQERPGFDHFIGSWVYPGELKIVVDVGPANSVNHLIASLRAMGIDRVDYILLTHIHIDHAGGLADFLDHFPSARVICHNNGIRHLFDPSRLWAGSRKALGDVAETYGPIKPVKQEKLIPHTEANIKDLEIIETPGHAPHHISFHYKGNLFAGEAGGNYFTIHDREYLRPATPPIFFFKDCLKSIEQLMALEDQTIYYAHFGSAVASKQFLKRFRDQLQRWKEIISKEIDTDSSQLITRCVDRLLEEDPELSAFEFMGPDTQERERFFIANSIRGYVGYLGNNQ